MLSINHSIGVMTLNGSYCTFVLIVGRGIEGGSGVFDAWLSDPQSSSDDELGLGVVLGCPNGASGS